MFDFFKKKFQEKTPMKIIKEELGSSGTENYSGFYSEEYFTGLLNERAAEVYDKMRRNDTQISLATSSIINSIVGGRWKVEPHKQIDGSEEEIEKYKTHADLSQYIIFDDLDKSWSKKLKEILTCIVFGHSVFERVHKVVIGNARFGDFIGIKKLGYRSQKTIYKWNFDLKTKDFIGITQMADGDLSNNDLVDIPAKDLYMFNIDSEGDNLEGISMLRQCYGSWKRKELFLKLMAIGIEKSAIGTPIGKYPSHEYGSTEYTNLKNALLALTSHNRNYMMLPQRQDGPSYEVDIVNFPFDSEKIKSAIEYEDMSVMRRFIAQFLMLGSGTTGSWSLSTDQSDFFLNGIIFIADMVAEEMNRLIKEITILNFGEQEYYPKLTHSRIKDKAGKEFAEIIKMGKDAGIIIPDDELETFFRNKYDIPEKQVGYTREEVEAKNQEKADMAFERNLEIASKKAPEPLDDKKVDKEVKEEVVDKKKKLHELSLAEKSLSKKMEAAGEDLSKIYMNELKVIGNDLVEQVIKNFNEATTDLQKISSARNIQPRNVSKFRKALSGTLKNITDSSINDVMELFKENTKLSEIMLAEKGNKGKKKADRYVVAQTDALVDTQVSDLKNAVVLQFASSVNEDSAKRIKSDLDEKMNKKLSQIDNAKMTVASTTINKAREFMLFDDDLIQEVESYTFKNPSPKAAICVSLNGKTFSTSDADSQRYTPPLHFNAVLEKSIIITKEGNKNIEDIKIGDLVKTHKGNFKEVYETMNKFDDKYYYEIELDNGNIINITGEHPLLTSNGWKQVFDLKISDNIICLEDINNV